MCQQMPCHQQMSQSHTVRAPQVVVCRENRTGEISVPRGAPVDVTGEELSTLTLLSCQGNLLCSQVKKNPTKQTKT